MTNTRSKLTRSIGAMLMVLSTATAAFAHHRDKYEPTIFIEPNSDFESYVAIAFMKKEVPGRIVMAQSEADFTIGTADLQRKYWHGIVEGSRPSTSAGHGYLVPQQEQDQQYVPQGQYVPQSFDYISSGTHLLLAGYGGPRGGNGGGASNNYRAPVGTWSGTTRPSNESGKGLSGKINRWAAKQANQGYQGGEGGPSGGGQMYEGYGIRMAGTGYGPMAGYSSNQSNYAPATLSDDNGNLVQRQYLGGPQVIYVEQPEKTRSDFDVQMYDRFGQIVLAVKVGKYKDDDKNKEKMAKDLVKQLNDFFKHGERR